MSDIEEPENRETRINSKRRLGIFVVGMIVLIMMALAYFYSEGPESQANTVVVAVRGYLSVEQKDALAAQFTGYAPEAGEEGIKLKVFEFPAGSTGGTAETSQLFNGLMNEIKTGSSDLLLLDSYVFDMLGDERLFEDLSLRYPGDPAVTGKYLYAIADKPFTQAAGLEGLPELYLVLRNAKSGIVNKNAQSLEKYQKEGALLDNIARSTPPDGFASQGLKK